MFYVFLVITILLLLIFAYVVIRNNIENWHNYKHPILNIIFQLVVIYYVPMITVFLLLLPVIIILVGNAPPPD